MNMYFKTKQELQKNLRAIPKKNRLKFQADLLKLIEYAKLEDYENYEV